MNTDEQVIKAAVLITPEGNPALVDGKRSKRAERFVIKDLDAGVFRSPAPLGHCDAWCSRIKEAKWHKTRKQAQDALYEMWGERMTPEEGEA